MADYYMKAGSSITPIQARLTDDAGNPADLQNGVLTFVVTSQLDYSELVNATATILVANPQNLTSTTQPNAKYSWSGTAQVNSPGVYRGEWRFTPTGGTDYQTFPGDGYITIQIEANNQ